ncbi:MAG: GNAT family N-acetyltransferase [Rhizobiales bacterium]|nr:GNAT family N-acetyltransferase [Hyphomicrobiales bacterium]
MASAVAIEQRQSGLAATPDIAIRRAVAGDVDHLVALENVSFSSDRVSRRSFQSFVTSPSALLLVAVESHEPGTTVAGATAGTLLGYALCLFRRGTGSARLYSIATAASARGRGVARALLGEMENALLELDRHVLRLEVDPDNTPAITLYRSLGFRPLMHLPHYYADGSDAVRMSKRLSGEPPAADRVPRYWPQTTDFTCGPACLMMALSRLSPGYEPSALDEIALWKVATTVYMARGIGGCEPVGIAVAAAERGLAAELHVSTDGPHLLQTVRDERKRRVMQLAQEDLAVRAEKLAIPVHRRRLSIAELRLAIDDGALAALLISGHRMLAERLPHWVLAYACNKGHVFVHDPFVDAEKDETALDAVSVPVPDDELERMWRHGRNNLRAAVIFRNLIAT